VQRSQRSALLHPNVSVQIRLHVQQQFNHMIKKGPKVRATFAVFDGKMATNQDVIIMRIMITVLLCPLVYGNVLQCKLCSGQFGVCMCSHINSKCVRIIGGRESIREIRLFSCGVRIAGLHGQRSLIRDRDGNVCIGEFFFFLIINPSYFWIGKS
jgi:hypothetical protein